MYNIFHGKTISNPISQSFNWFTTFFSIIDSFYY